MMRKTLDAVLFHGLIAAAWLACAPAEAQVIPVEDFARHSEISDIALSPTGEYVALAIPQPDGMETQLHIVNITSGATQVLRFGRQNHVSDLTWTGDEQITVSRAKMEPLHARPYSMGELVSSDVTGKNQETLFAYIPDSGTRSGRRKDQGFASIVKVLDKEPGNALVAFTCWSWVCGEEPDAVIYEVDTVTGQRREIERVGKPADFMFDNDGIARVMIASDEHDNPEMSYRRSATGAWAPLPETLAGYSIAYGRFAADNNTLYALVSDDREPAQLYRLDLAAGTRERLAGHADIGVGTILFAGRNGLPFAVMHDAGPPKIEYLEPASEWTQLHAALMRRFPGELVYFNQFSRDDRKVLFTVTSGRHPGASYVMDRDDKSITLVSEWSPWIDPAKMAPVRPIEFTSRDGQKLFGFYTAHGTGPKPMVVMPHGGPHGVHDSWGFDSDAQFLASRGYAVLQVNFRGSSGRGQAFVQAGYREWGGKIQDDIADAVRWTIEQNLADPERICTYGASFGGYAALMNPIRYPGMYRCAIGNVGVYDLAMMFEEGDIPDQRSGRRYLERVIGTDETVLSANSPARNVAKIDIPVMLAQGTLDRRVPMDQFEALVDAFEANGRPAETLVISGEGHGFYKPENRARLLRMMEEFLDQHIGAGAAGAANASASAD